MKLRVVRSKRKTLCLVVKRNGEAFVRAPYSASEKSIEKFVQEREHWLAVHLEKVRNRRELELDNFQTLVLFGKPYTIREGKSKIADGVVYLPAGNRESTLLRLIKKIAAREMTNVVEDIAWRYGFQYESVRISAARTRWGSCSKKGVISFSCFIAFIDPALAVYVAVHELCHTRYFNHSYQFWREVEEILPDWRKLRAALKQEEDCLEYLRNS